MVSPPAPDRAAGAAPSAATCRRLLSGQPLASGLCGSHPNLAPVVGGVLEAASQAPAPAAPRPALAEVLKDPTLVKGWSPSEVAKLIPPDWAQKPLNKGAGTRFFNPAKPGEVVMIEAGWPGATDPVHAGPYMRLGSGGKVGRVPLGAIPRSNEERGYSGSRAVAGG